MISIERPKTPPSVLRPTSESRINAEAAIQQIIDAGNDPRSTDFDSLWGRKPVRRALWNMQNGRCCYCERYRDKMRESDIEHFRPKTEVEEKNPSKPGYWWLAYEWENLFFACRLCNQEFKKTQFPIQGTRAISSADNLDVEEPYLIDAAKENPEDFIDYDFTHPLSVNPNGKAPNRERGNKTIEVCGLDRQDLGLQRKVIIPALRAIQNRMILALESGNEVLERRIGRQISDATTAKVKHEFVGMRRAYFRARDLGEYVATD